MNTSEQSPTQNNLVMLGGGSIAALSAGLSEALPDHYLTRVITASDGGSVSGELARKYGTLPTGDFRKTLSYGAADKYVGSLNEMRFDEHATHYELQQRSDAFLDAVATSNPLADMNRASSLIHSAIEIGKDQKTLNKTALGHLLLTAAALDHGNHMGKGIDEIGSLMMISGRIVPATLTPHRLMLRDGNTIIAGEENIDYYAPHRLHNIHMWLSPDVIINPDAASAIKSSPNAIIGPGSLLTSLIPSLLPNGTPEALKNSRLIVIGNAEHEFPIAPEQDKDPGEIFLETLERYVGKQSDVLICHDPSTGEFSQKSLTYRHDRLERQGRRVIVGNILKQAGIELNKSNEVVHDPRAILAAYDLTSV